MSRGERSRNTSPHKRPRTIAEPQRPSRPVAVSEERLQRFLARAGFASRRAGEDLIRAGRVSVNGALAVLGQKVTAKDIVRIDEQVVRLKMAPTTRVLLYHKPVGVVCSRRDEANRPTVFADLPSLREGRWLNVGRLDVGTSGLLLFTNDGDMANRLAHPSSCIDREYVVRLRGEATDEAIQHMLEGVLFDDGPARFSDLTKGESSGSHSWYYVTVLEGKNREVRRLFESQGYEVSRLKRVRFGPVVLPSWVRQGEVLELTADEIRALAELVGYEPQQLSQKEPRRDKRSPLVPYPSLSERKALVGGDR